MARNNKDSQVAAWAGFDLSTTGLALGVRSREGTEAFEQTRMRGATTWQGQPAFDLAHVPRMALSLLEKLQKNGWTFNDMFLSFSVRQHDMVLLGRDSEPLIPTLSWQCNAASKQVQHLRDQGAEQTVGRIEERFILPKLMWALKRMPSLRRRVTKVMTTGDWIAQLLTGKSALSTSDALSNGLLDQSSKALAAAVMKKAGLSPGWFPKVLQSGRVVGRVNSQPEPGAGTAWMKLKQMLAGARVVAGLGDNHATGVGCGLEEEDFQTIIVSAGTSGTVNRVCPAGASLAGNAACFEFYRSRMLLMMLADCCKWYDRFVARYTPAFKRHLDDLNDQIYQSDLHHVRRVVHSGGRETYPPHWRDLTPGDMAASTQLSIMLELLLLVRSMLAEVSDGQHDVNRFVLTGGLGQSKFFQEVFCTGVKILAPKAKVLISARKGPMRFQTAAYGALLNAMRPEDSHAAAKLCPTRAAARPDATLKSSLEYLLRSYGL